LLEFEATERRLRCAGHIFNLVAHSILFGTDNANLEPIGDAIHDDDILSLELAKWRSKGPIGKLHNIVLWIRRSALHRERLQEKQRELGFKDKKQLVQDNSTRWNSTYYSLQRAVELRQPVEAILDEEMSTWQLNCRKAADTGKDLPPQPSHLVDYLSQHDWSTITDLLLVLKPLEQATKLLQGHGAGASHGSIWQVIPFMEKLFSHFEDIRKRFNLPPPGDDLQVTLEDTQNTQNSIGRASLKRRQARSKAAPLPAPAFSASSSQEHRLLCTNVNAGWAKLNKYYALTDMSSSYVAAVVLHPAYTWRWLKNKWASKPAWIRDAERRVESLWADYSCLDVNLRSPVAATTARQPPRVVETDCIFDISDDEGALDASEDEYLVWCQQPRNSLVNQPLSFWTTEVIQRQYPRLSRMAIDLFTIPAMSDEPERTFSSCSLMITSHRGSLESDVVEFTQCTKNWLKNGVITPHISIRKKDDDDDDDEETTSID
jgi:hypothetical protein